MPKLFLEIDEPKSKKLRKKSNIQELQKFPAARSALLIVKIYEIEVLEGMEVLWMSRPALRCGKMPPYTIYELYAVTIRNIDCTSIRVFFV